MKIAPLIKAARRAALKAHAPYSKFHVGAALVTSTGKVFTGCNIENSSYGLTMCAERTVLFKARSEGVKDIAAIVIVSDDPGFTYPCGACRQVMMELGGENFKVILANRKNEVQMYTMRDLLPAPFFSKKITHH